MLKQLSAFAIALILSLCFTSTVEAATPRPAWVQNEIYQYNHPYTSQLPQELSTKMQKMAVNPFGFYRGTAHIFYKDMQTLPSSSFVNLQTSAVWLEGDMHLQNLGGIKDNKDNNIFDTTDFDESYLGPYVWDLRRMAVSILLAAKENGISPKDAQDVVRNFLDVYLNKMNDFKGTDDELTYRLDSGNTTGVVSELISKAANKKRSDLLDKYTEINKKNGERVFQIICELQPVSNSIYSNISAAMSKYIASTASNKQYSSSYYTLKDIRLKLGSGTGSLGRYRYYLLIEGASSSTNDDVILEMKQETTSVVKTSVPGLLSSSYYGNHEGGRVALGMKAMLANADPLVGYTTVNNIPFMIREKSPYQVDFDYNSLTTKSKFMDAISYVAKVVAKNHAISDQDYNSTIIPYNVDKQITDSVSDKSAFKDEIVNFALDYATQVEYDYQSFFTAYKQEVILN